MDNNSLDEAYKQATTLTKALKEIVARIEDVVNNSEVKNNILNENTSEKSLLTTKQILPYQENELYGGSDPYRISTDRSKPLPENSGRRFVQHRISPIVETFKYMYNAGPLPKEGQSKLPPPNEEKPMGNLETLAREEEDNWCEDAAAIRESCNKVETKRAETSEEPSGLRPMEYSPLMGILPLNISQTVRSLNLNNTRLRLAANDVITALARFDNLLMEEEETPAFAEIDGFLARYVKFEPWEIYTAAFAILMGRCGLKDTKNEEKEG